MSCHTCGEPACGGCDPCNDQDSYCVCLGRQIEQTVNRTDQLMAYVERLNTGEPFDDLCPVQTCNSPDCANTGTICENESPTGRPVGSGQGDSCCGQANPANLTDYCEITAKKVRELERRVGRLERQYCQIRDQALQTVLLDNEGNARGGLDLNGNLVTFQTGSWELANS